MKKKHIRESERQELINDYNYLQLEGASGTIYFLTKIIGRGTYGVVYEAYGRKSNYLDEESDKHHLNQEKNISIVINNNIDNIDFDKKYAVKRYFKSFNPNYGQIELSILSYLNNKINDKRIIKILDGNYIEQTGDFFFITPFIQHNHFSEYFKTISFEKLQIYMYQLLTCLKKIHEVGIIHRDIKPENFLFNLETNDCCLIDFGLAEIDSDSNIWKEINKNNQDNQDYIALTEIQKNNYRHKIGTRGFLPPEVIFYSSYQNESVDIWAAGIIFLIILSQRLSVFNLNQFSKIENETIKSIIPLVILYGKEKIIETARISKSSLFIGDAFDKYKLPDGIETLISKKAENMKDKKLLILAKDLLSKLLNLNFKTRISAAEALKHEFFKGVKNKIS